jgi:hypothetical protein
MIDTMVTTFPQDKELSFEEERTLREQIEAQKECACMESHPHVKTDYQGYIHLFYNDNSLGRFFLYKGEFLNSTVLKSKVYEVSMDEWLDAYLERPPQ